MLLPLYCMNLPSYNVEALLCSGGCGGGAGWLTQNSQGAAGGGGAGGAAAIFKLMLTLGVFNVVIGAGGVGSTAEGVKGTPGGSTSISNNLTTLLSLGGSTGGGSFSDKDTDAATGPYGNTGGSSYGGTSGLPSLYGFRGGNANFAVPNNTGGGGAGAGANGGLPTNGPAFGRGKGGLGGLGLYNNWYGVDHWLGSGAGGGSDNGEGPAAGGADGGGAGATAGPDVNPVAGTANQGGGGGGGAGGGVGGSPDYKKGANGGSGRLILRYPTGLITATGGSITTVGGNTLHTFTASGLFTITALAA